MILLCSSRSIVRFQSLRRDSVGSHVRRGIEAALVGIVSIPQAGFCRFTPNYLEIPETCYALFQSLRRDSVGSHYAETCYALTRAQFQSLRRDSVGSHSPCLGP